MFKRATDFWMQFPELSVCRGTAEARPGHENQVDPAPYESDGKVSSTHRFQLCASMYADSFLRYDYFHSKGVNGV